MANCVSRLPCMSKPSNGENEFKGRFIDFTKIKILKDEDHTFYTNKFPKQISSCSNEDTDMTECCMILTTLAKMQCLVKLEQIQQHTRYMVLFYVQGANRDQTLYPAYSAHVWWCATDLSTRTHNGSKLENCAYLILNVQHNKMISSCTRILLYY